MRFQLTVLAALAGLATSAQVQAQTAASPGYPPPGQHSVGFRAAYHLDLARNWLGDSTRGRPLRVYLWYPAQAATGRSMTFGDYLTHPGSTPSGIFPQLDSLLDARATESFARWLKAEHFAALKASHVVARLNATPAAGTFPVIAYSAGLNDSFEASNSYLFEFLASQGFIVVTVPQVGAAVASLDLGTSAADIETQMRDLDEAVGWLRTEQAFSLGAVVPMGHSMGGSVALLTTMRHPSYRAVIGLDASYAAPGLATALAVNPLFNPGKLTVPLLDIRRADPRWDLSVLAALSAGPRRLVQVNDMSHMGFTNDARVVSEILADSTAVSALNGYQFTRDVILTFLQAVVSESPDALSRFDRYLRSRSADIARVTISP